MRIRDIEKDLWAADDELRQTRDLFLPRLISGELDVSEIEFSGVNHAGE